MPVTIIQPSTIDVELNASDPNTNYNADPYLRVGDTAWRSLITFSFAAIPAGSKVISATMELYLDAAIGDQTAIPLTVSVYRVKRVWTEVGATWNKYDGANNWQVAGCGGALDVEGTSIGSLAFGAAPVVGAWYSWSLNPAAIEAMISGGFANNGFLLRTASGTADHVIFDSREFATVGLRPKITIVWTPPLGRLPAYIVDGLQGGITLKATVEQFANETWVRHTPVGGALTRTPAAHSIDLASQAKFGRKDQPLQGGSSSVTIADQISDTYLSFQSTPNMPDITIAPGTVIKDQNGNVVPPEEIRPNNWMLIENLALPTSQVWASLTANPMALFIEEVSFDEVSGLGITAGRDRFTQALVARIAGRGGG